MSNGKPIVLLPYCVENVSKLKQLAEEQNFTVKILEHSNEALEIVKKYHPTYILGVACSKKAEKVGKQMHSIGEKGEAFILNCQSCMKVTGEKTKINQQEYIEVLKRIKESHF